MAEKVAIGNICSLMFFSHVFNNVFIKVKKTCFYVLYLQTNVSNIYGIDGSREKEVYSISMQPCAHKTKYI